MSAVTGDEVLKPILLRSSTPGHNEKVWKYLEGMNRDSATIEPPPSIFGEDARSEGVRSPGKKSSKARSQVRRDDRERSEVSYVNGEGVAYTNGHAANDDDDVKSNTQVGVRSELDLDVNGFDHEPGPTDPPGPHYESYDSGPSFGNFGPMPQEGEYQPHWQSNQYTGHDSQVAHAANYALPESVASPRSASAKIVVESPSSPRSKQKSRVSDRTSGESPMTPTKARSSKSNAESPQAPLSPRSRTETVPGTVYPPLPTSPTGEGGYSEYAMSPRARSKAPSISPSDSASHFKPYRSQKPKSNTDSKPPSRREVSRSPPPAGPSHGSRPFSPWRQAATTQDLMHAAVRGRAFIPDTIEENDQSQVSGSVGTPPAPASPKKSSKAPSVASCSRVQSDAGGGKSPSKVSSKAPSARPPSSKAPSTVSPPPQADGEEDRTATPRPRTPTELSKEEENIIKETLSRKHHPPMTPRTSYAPSVLEPEVVHSHFHDDDLCELLRQEGDPNVSEVVKRVIRKAIRSRVKKLGMKYDARSLEEYKKSVHDFDTLSQHPNTTNGDEPPEWAKELIQGMVLMQQRIEGLGPKIEGLKGNAAPLEDGSRFKAIDDDEVDEYDQSGMTQTVDIHTRATGTMADSMYQPPDTDILVGEHDHGLDGAEYDDEHDHDHDNDNAHTEGGETYPRRAYSDLQSENRDDSPGQQYLEEELYKLRQRQAGSQSGMSHRTWEVARDDGTQIDDYDDENPGAAAPTIPDSNAGGYTDQRTASPPLPPIPPPEDRRIATPQQIWQAGQDYNAETPPLAPWQRIHQRLLGWAIIWPMSELENALRSTTRSHQVDEVALSIWTTQTYKRYVRTRMTDTPQGVVDRLFVPPNMADAISSAVFNGRHGDACGMLRDLWSPFGLEGMPRLLVVLAKHRNDPNHWLVHRFSLPDGSLTTYDTYPGRAIHDGRPLGWWFAIRIAWPNALYPSPDHLLQKMVRVHRPLQLPVDNAVAAAGIWRNILMGSRAERSLDLERLRDLINTEVKNLRQRKEMGKLSIGGPRPSWDDMN